MNELQLKNIVQFNKNGVLSPNDTLGDALKVISSDSISSIVVIDENNFPIGIFTEFDVLKVIANNILISVPLRTVMSNEPFTVSDSMYLHDAYLLLNEKGYRHLIVVDEENKYCGIISEGDFLRFMSFEHLDKIGMVSHIMDKSPLLIAPDLSIQEVAQQMSDHHCEYAIAVEDLKPIGIVDERTIAHYFVNSPNNNQLYISEIIDVSIHFISKDIVLEEAAQLLTKHSVHELIVVDDEKHVIGLLKRNDILKAIHGHYLEFLISTIEKKSETLEKLIAEQKILEEKTSFLHTLINTIPDLVWLKDVDGKYLTCNHAFERLYNTSQADIIGKKDENFVAKDLADFFREHDQLAMKEGKSVYNEEYLVFQDGSYEGTFETLKTPIKDKEDNVVGILGIARDISERIQKEQEFQKVHEEFRSAQELAHVGSWMWDIEKNYFRGSEETHRIFGLAIDKTVTFDEMLSIVHPDDRDMVQNAFESGTLTGIYNLVHRILVNNEVRWIHSSAKLYQNEMGHYVMAQGMLQDITRQQLYELELEKLANFDSLTGLANRTYLLAHLQKLIYRNNRNKNNAAILLFDLDHFRDVNDSFGHNIGDELLIQVAKRMNENIRHEDFLAHLSGDEFVLVLEKLSQVHEVTKVVEKMVNIVSQPYLLTNNIEVRIGVSTGIVLLPNEIIHESELLQFADVALYKAKKEGRNCYRFYSNELTISVQERIQYQNEIFYALQNNEFELYYQPQVHIETNRIIGVEALIRWNHPTKGLISPNVFIPIAEESGLIANIGVWTLKEGCKQGKIWLDSGYDIHMSINVSMKQLRYHNLVEVVDEALEESGFSPDKLILELTESAMMQHQEELAAMLHQLRAKGIGIAIDDFGTGYSSYSYLKLFPIDILKIDKSFIDDIPYKKDAMAIVKAIISMSEILGYQILAEGVEYIEQADFLKQEKCHYYQGYLKSKPLRASDFISLFLFPY